MPIIAIELPRPYAENLERSPARRFITGTMLGDNISGLMDTAFHLKPETRQVALVAGTTPNDVHGEQIFRRGLKPYGDKIEIIDLTKLTREKKPSP